MSEALLNHIKDLKLNDLDFYYQGKKFNYADIKSIDFYAAITQHKVNAVPTGKSYDIHLVLVLDKKWVIKITSRTGLMGRVSKTDFESIQMAYAVFAEMSFNQRLDAYEQQIKEKNYFRYGDYTFHKSGSIFKGNVEIANILGQEHSFLLSPFDITIVKKNKSISEKIGSMFSSKDLTIDLSTDKDCLIYLINSQYGISWESSPPRERRVDKHDIFYKAVLKFGALLSIADGHADPEELQQLKSYFQIDKAEIKHAGKIFNEYLYKKESVASVLSDFKIAFADAPEVKESFIMGMITVAYADGEFSKEEYDLIIEAVEFLGLPDGALERLAAATGVNFEFYRSSDQRSESRQQDESEQKSESRHESRSEQKSSTYSGQSAESRYFKILGLNDSATVDEIKSAYRALAKKYHPDVLLGKGMPAEEIEKSQKILVQINEAYRILMNNR